MIYYSIDEIINIDEKLDDNSSNNFIAFHNSNEEDIVDYNIEHQKSTETQTSPKFSRESRRQLKRQLKSQRSGRKSKTNESNHSYNDNIAMTETTVAVTQNLNGNDSANEIVPNHTDEHIEEEHIIENSINNQKTENVEPEPEVNEIRENESDSKSQQEQNKFDPTSELKISPSPSVEPEAVKKESPINDATDKTSLNNLLITEQEVKGDTKNSPKATSLTPKSEKKVKPKVKKNTETRTSKTKTTPSPSLGNKTPKVKITPSPSINARTPKTKAAPTPKINNKVDKNEFEEVRKSINSPAIVQYTNLIDGVNIPDRNFKLTWAQVNVWSPETLRTLAILSTNELGKTVAGIAFSHKGFLIVACVQKRLKLILWNWRKQEIMLKATQSLRKEEVVLGIACHPSNLLCATYGQKHLRLWEFQRNRFGNKSIVSALSGENGELCGLRSIATHPGRTTIYSLSLDHKLCKWEFKLLVWKCIMEEQCASIAVHPSARIIALGTASGAIVIVNSEDGEKTSELHISEEPIGCLQFSMQGDLLAAGTQDGIIYILPVTENSFSYEKVSALKGPSPILTLQWSTDGQYILTSVNESNFQELILWDLPNFRYMRGCSSIIRKIEWYDATCSGGDDVRGIWDNSNVHDINYISCHCSFDHKYLASGDDKGVIRLFSYPCFDPDSGYYKAYQGSTGVVDVRFLPDNEHFVTANFEGSIFLWELFIPEANEQEDE
ncbi:echinoderm microtubule-associated protein-like CG42247 [Dinothrombium tinctorium]|uniref:Echinoderm microtubule-associated protein-like CG42247 n=1 Tax=Dinothrombium tinctorium TaxID=1965070 RepID=A0A3S3NX90_9ACAR|nr:echinoderm microtubule-associated protein-like CG42247 [Dinothrombium tinctorium]